MFKVSKVSLKQLYITFITRVLSGDIRTSLVDLSCGHVIFNFAVTFTSGSYWSLVANMSTTS